MAHNSNNTLAAYYGKLCRNVGTKALMHMSPALKRTLCKRCSLPLLPGVNTTLKLEEQKQQKVTKKQRNRKLRKKLKQEQAGKVPVPSDHVDDNAQLYLECSLCQAKRRFNLNTKKECWLERSEAIVQTVSLEQQSGEEQTEAREEMK